MVFAVYVAALTMQACLGGGNTTGAGGTGGLGGGNTTGAGGLRECGSDTGTTCANAVRGYQCCLQGTASLGTIVRGVGFTEYEGRAVKAAIALGGSRGSRAIDLSVT